ncbi:hypothetical protein ACWDAO_40045 [Streptomyces sp. NPDC001212]
MACRRTMGVPGALADPMPMYRETGRSGYSVTGLLRHPYEPWSANYAHHEHSYTGNHSYVLQALLPKTPDARALHRLGDPWGCSG